MHSAEPAQRIRLLLLVLTGIASPAFGQEADAAPATNAEGYQHEAPAATAIRATGPIRIDGDLVEPVWSGPAITSFTQLDPDEGVPGSQPTEVRIAYDGDAIYIAARLSDSFPVTTRLTRRDGNLGDSDSFEVTLDSYHDHQTAYRFTVNPSGVRQDAVISGGRGGGDDSWDPVWDVATSIDAGGWTAEIRIPFSQLRFSRAPRQVWGIQLQRRIQRNQEESIFAFTPKLEFGGVPRFGHLEGIAGIEPGQRLELLPYAAARAEYRDIPPTPDSGLRNPFQTGSDYVADVGMDLKYRISSNVTLDATVNPDFGQVEVDPAVINLSAFETRYEEKRPFFVEGADIFRFGEGGPQGSTGRGPQLLYSRRIGRAPQVGLPTGVVFSESPATTTILGAAKITGRMANGWSVGVLEALTNRETASYLSSSGTVAEAPVEPLTNYLVGRLRRDLRGGQTRLGIIATSVNRQLDDGALANRLRSAAYSGGVDFVHEWGERMWRLNGAFTPSYVTGSPEAMVLTQRSSARYYQRPDADHLELDPGATSLGGYYAMIDMNKQSGAVIAKLAIAAASPGYEANDLGFQTAADRIMLDTNLQYSHVTPGEIFRNWNIRGSPDAVWNYDGDIVFNEINTSGAFTLLNYWGGGGRLAYNPSVYNDRLTRGGPLSRDPAGYYGNLFASTDSRRPFVGRATWEWAFDEAGGYSHSGDLRMTYRLGSNWDFALAPSLQRSYSVGQYVSSVADPLATSTFGRRYLFAGIDQTTLAVETRVNVTFTPKLSFQLYAQPFFSSGDYDEIKELAGPGVFEFLTYGEDIGRAELVDGVYDIDPDGDGPASAFTLVDPDFNYRSVRGNAVLRWEWRPGSTFFFVWQQGREDRLRANNPLALDGRVGRFDLNRDIRDLLDLSADNIFQIKVNYWFNP